MIIFKRAADLKRWLGIQRRKALFNAFVPTMGALHEGHLSLLREAATLADITVCSIFVNPTQFNDPKDFEKYPITIEEDIRLLLTVGTHALLLPAVAEIYPQGTDKPPHYDLGKLEKLLEGEFRPGHFQGVCMVVDRLLQITEPDKLVMGQKDYQQCMVINRLLALTGRQQTELIVSPTLRETDGLAMSSRNRRLTDEDRSTAPAIYAALSMLRSELVPGELQPLQEKAVIFLQEKGFRVDYVQIADAITLDPVTVWDGEQKLVALVAAFLGDVRLIDNLILN